MYPDHEFKHGGNIFELADKAGCTPDQIIDFSSSINPLGPPSWVKSMLLSHPEDISAYPEPESTSAVLAACEYFQVWPTQAMAGNGATELIHLVARASGLKQAAIPVPAYVDYHRAAKLAGMQVTEFPLDPAKNFTPDFDALDHLLTSPALVFLGQPNNPTGNCFDPDEFRSLAANHPDSLFVVDESFADFVPGLDRLVAKRPDNVVAVLSLTKFFAIPGLRFGLAFAHPERIVKLKSLLPSWSVNRPAQRVAEACFQDTSYINDTIREVAELRACLARDLSSVPGIRVYPSQANFLLCQTTRVGQDAKPLAETLIKSRVAIRLCDNFPGLDSTFFRVAVKDEENNRILVNGLKGMSGIKGASLGHKPTPAVMIQGCSSGAGKSLVATALCRILMQDGHTPAPFKARHMSANSHITEKGREMGLAQATQAMACGMAPDHRMSPVLIKPGANANFQVTVMGKAYKTMDSDAYLKIRPKLFEQVTQVYDKLSREHSVMVLEGEGSPSEVNLKAFDLANMAMARHARAKVLLVGDMDRGGVFANLVGTMELLDQRDKKLVAGYVLNNFRGDESLLESGLAHLQTRTGLPVLGTIPHTSDTGLPKEDSLGLESNAAGKFPSNPGADIDLALIDLPRIANFTDFDPFLSEPDVNLRLVRNVSELKTPDCVLIPGTENLLADMAYLRGQGLAQAIRELPLSCVVVGICGGFQMLGQCVGDPMDTNSDLELIEGIGLLPMETEMRESKTMSKTTATHLASALGISGYEALHGAVTPLLSLVKPAVSNEHGNPMGYGLKDGRVWGAFLHGMFDTDEFRRWFINDLRGRKGLAPFTEPVHFQDLNAALDRWADIVRAHIDMDKIYQALGL